MPCIFCTVICVVCLFDLKFLLVTKSFLLNGQRKSRECLLVSQSPLGKPGQYYLVKLLNEIFPFIAFFLKLFRILKFIVLHIYCSLSGNKYLIVSPLLLHLDFLWLSDELSTSMSNLQLPLKRHVTMISIFHPHHHLI